MGHPQCGEGKENQHERWATRPKGTHTGRRQCSEKAPACRRPKERRTKMNMSRAAITVLILCSLLPVEGNAQPSTPIQSQVESVLDSWQGWKAARESLLKFGKESDVVGALGAISQAGGQSYARRSHAIELLATFKIDESVKMLERV